MGKGDKKTKRGKIVRGSYGKLRPRNKSRVLEPVATAEKKAKPAKTETTTAKKSKAKSTKAAKD